MKGKSSIVLTKKHLGKKTLIEQKPYSDLEVYLHVEANGLDVYFSYGATQEKLKGNEP